MASEDFSVAYEARMLLDDGNGIYFEDDKWYIEGGGRIGAKLLFEMRRSGEIEFDVGANMFYLNKEALKADAGEVETGMWGGFESIINGPRSSW